MGRRSSEPDLRFGEAPPPLCKLHSSNLRPDRRRGSTIGFRQAMRQLELIRVSEQLVFCPSNMVISLQYIGHVYRYWPCPILPPSRATSRVGDVFFWQFVTEAKPGICRRSHFKKKPAIKTGKVRFTWILVDTNAAIVTIYPLCARVHV
jgi:hypothetical protein